MRQKQKPLPGPANRSSSTSPPKPWDRPTPTRSNCRTAPTIGEPFWTARVGIDVYGNNGIAAGDFDNNGFDSLYICQPAGLPNRLYRNRGDGSFEDVTENAGVGVLDNTACALFADFENKGLQDLLVVSGNGPPPFCESRKWKVRLEA